MSGPGRTGDRAYPAPGTSHKKSRFPIAGEAAFFAFRPSCWQCLLSYLIPRAAWAVRFLASGGATGRDDILPQAAIQSPDGRKPNSTGARRAAPEGKHWLE